MATKNRIILITGCSAGGAGHALALQFAAYGLRVFATARSTNSLRELADKGVETLPLDVTSHDSIASLKKEITRRTGGKLDMLFNNAGTMYEAPAIEADPARIRNMFDANVLGLFDVITAFTPLLLASTHDLSMPPTIINTASILARVPFPFSAAYNASKAAVASYSDTLRLELAPLGVKVVTLYMGEVSTGLMSPNNVSFGPDSLYVDLEQKVKARSIGHTESSMKPDEFARQVVDEVLRKSPKMGQGEHIWKGTNAFPIWLLDAVGWKKIFDGSMKSTVGLDDRQINQAIFEKGQGRSKNISTID